MQETNNKYWWGGNTSPKKGTMLIGNKTPKDWFKLIERYENHIIVFFVGFLLGFLI